MPSGQNFGVAPRRVVLGDAVRLAGVGMIDVDPQDRRRTSRLGFWPVDIGSSAAPLSPSVM